MYHEHGDHNCYCPSCGYSLTVKAYVKCKSLRCPQCGDRMRATETGEYRVAEQPAGGVKVADQVSSLIAIDNQAIDATWFGEARWLTDFITPDALEVQDLFQQITEGIESSRDRILACWEWVANKIKYVRFVTGKTWIAGKTSVQNDLWLEPTTTIQVGKGNCLSRGTKLIVVNPKGQYELKAIEELRNYEGYKAISYNFERHRVEFKPIINWFDNGERETLNVRFNNGETLGATPDHVCYTCQDGEFQEIRLLDAIGSASNLINIRRVPPASKGHHYPKVAAGHKAAHGGYHHSYEHLWVAGHYLAEGNSSDSHVRIANDDPRLRMKLCDYLEFLQTPYSQSNLPHSNYVAVLRRKAGQRKTGFKDLQANLRLLGHTAPEKSLTPELLSLSRPGLIAIMDGYCDGDSYLPARINVRRKFSSKHCGRFRYHYKRSILLQHSTVSVKLAEQLKLMHLILGRPLHSHNGPSYGAGRNPLPRWVLTEHLRPSYKRGSAIDLGQLKITKTESPKTERVYDIEVADNHNFMLANGLLVHNCAVKSFLLASLLRNELPPDHIYVALGNLYNGKAGGHAWVKLILEEGEYYMESTMPTAPPLVPAVAADRYEAVHYFNDEKVFAVEGRTQLVPFTACYSDWLASYLHWAYIEGNRR